MCALTSRSLSTLSQATGELTPTLKVKCEVAYDRSAEVFASLYEEDQP